MVEDQLCPLCGDKIKEIMEPSMPQIIRYCLNENCIVSKGISSEEDISFNELINQIARIKETAFKEGCLKAKQEVFDEIDKNGQQAICYLCKGRPSHLEYYNEIKKKHGVE